MHVDVMMIPQALNKVGDLARRTQAAGFSGLLITRDRPHGVSQHRFRLAGREVARRMMTA
ncbi:hypothetical protein BMG05_20620 [Mycobacterium malmoense]|nr:hypothetical protein BMG05_20620 [Mycobacterium malmoense]